MKTALCVVGNQGLTIICRSNINLSILTDNIALFIPENTVRKAVRECGHVDGYHSAYRFLFFNLVGSLAVPSKPTELGSQQSCIEVDDVFPFIAFKDRF